MIRFEKIDELIWRYEIHYDEEDPYEVAEEFTKKYPNASVEIEKCRFMPSKRQAIYYWMIDIIFKNVEDEAVFIMRESI